MRLAEENQSASLTRTSFVKYGYFIEQIGPDCQISLISHRRSYCLEPFFESQASRTLCAALQTHIFALTSLPPPKHSLSADVPCNQYAVRFSTSLLTASTHSAPDGVTGCHMIGYTEPVGPSTSSDSRTSTALSSCQDRRCWS